MNSHRPVAVRAAATARLARPQHRPILHLPTHWPCVQTLAQAVHNTINTTHQHQRHPDHHADRPRPEHTGKLDRPAVPHAHTPESTIRKSYIRHRDPSADRG